MGSTAPKKGKFVVRGVEYEDDALMLGDYALLEEAGVPALSLEAGTVKHTLARLFVAMHRADPEITYADICAIPATELEYIPGAQSPPANRAARRKRKS